MKYCTNCGEQTREKKICKSCGVKLCSTHNFCELCGTSLEENSKKCPNCSEKTKPSFILWKIARWLIAVFFLISALSFIGKSWITSIAFLLFAVMILPVTRKAIKQLTVKKLKLHKIMKYAYGLIAVVVFIVGISAVPPSTPSSSSDGSSFSENNKKPLSEKEIEQEVKATAQADIHFYVVNHYSNVSSARAEINSIDTDGNVYKLYGKVVAKDKFGDEYRGNFTATYQYSIIEQDAVQTTLNIDDLYKN